LAEAKAALAAGEAERARIIAEFDVFDQRRAEQGTDDDQEGDDDAASGTARSESPASGSVPELHIA
jgi:hypothetical protein